jgi:16S rRNA G527 N7-methylase RsmG
LKIMRLGLHVIVVESNLKKATFLAEVIRELGLTGTQVLVSRYEELAEEIAPLDYVCARALGDFPRFLQWAQSDQIAAKQVILWIGAKDLADIQKNLEWEWAEPVQVPHSLRRLILWGRNKRAIP